MKARLEAERLRREEEEKDRKKQEERKRQEEIDKREREIRYGLVDRRYSVVIEHLISTLSYLFICSFNLMLSIVNNFVEILLHSKIFISKFVLHVGWLHIHVHVYILYL